MKFNTTIKINDKRNKNYIQKYKDKIVFYYDYKDGSKISGSKIEINIEDLKKEINNIYKEIRFDKYITIQICSSQFFKINLN